MSIFPRIICGGVEGGRQGVVERGRGRKRGSGEDSPRVDRVLLLENFYYYVVVIVTFLFSDVSSSLRSAVLPKLPLFIARVVRYLEGGWSGVVWVRVRLEL